MNGKTVTDAEAIESFRRCISGQLCAGCPWGNEMCVRVVRLILPKNLLTRIDEILRKKEE